MDLPNTEPQMNTAPAPSAEPTAPAAALTPWYKRRPIMIAIVAAILILAAAGYYLYTHNYKQGGIVATVNGEPIYRVDYEDNLQVLEENAAAQGINTDDEAFKADASTQALDNLINNRLLVSAAHDADIQVADADIDAVRSQLVESVGGEEALAARMEEIGLTEDQLHSNIEERILIENYIESVSDVESITVTDEEIQAFIDQNVPPDAETGEMPSMEDLRPVVEAQIRSMKQQEMVAKVIDDLRAAATIDVRL